MTNKRARTLHEVYEDWKYRRLSILCLMKFGHSYARAAELLRERKEQG